MQVLDIMIYAAIAAFLAYRLWSVLGQREEGDDTSSRPNPFGPAEKPREEEQEKVLILENKGAAAPVVSALTSAGHAPTSLAGALDKIKETDTSFEEKKFLEGAKFAFQKIVTAFAAGDLEPVGWLLGPNVRDPFEQAIKVRKERGQTLENKIERIVAVDIVGARTEGSFAVVSVEFVTHQVNLLKDSEGRLLDGELHKAEEVRDTWTFRRDMGSSNPNWQLVETGA